MIELCCEYLSRKLHSLYYFIMSRTRFRVNLHSTVSWMSKKVLLKADATSEILVRATGCEPTTTYFVNEASTIYPKWPNDWAALWALICSMLLNVYYYHVTYPFQSEYIFFSCLIVKELVAQKRNNIWSLKDSNGISSFDRLVCRETLNHLCQLHKLLSYVARTYLQVALHCVLFSRGIQVKMYTPWLSEDQGTPW